MKRIFSSLFIIGLLFSLLPTFKVEAATEKDLLNIAKSHIGVPYLTGGTTPKGFDCSGFLVYVFNKIGVSVPRTAAEQATVGKSVDKSALQPGDLVFFKNTVSGKSGVTHSGIYTGDNSFISATSSKGIAIVSLDNTYWAPKYAGAKRISYSASNSTTFSDIDKDFFAKEAIQQLNVQQVIQGFEDGTFRPNESVTREQAAAIINRVLKRKSASLYSYKDVATSSRFASDIAAIKELGVINGFEDGTFRPKETMTRAQMAIIVQNAFKLDKKITYSASSIMYSDVPPSYRAYNAIMIMKKIDTTSGFQTPVYRTGDDATRAFFSAAIYNAINL
ncbi:C40 family peptidase [Bacillus cihuensis]|uniref:C40 family peptidase n=1 Tax=Bacillus cihuensis TaxID=1208599 RepID=UPI000420586F|nr:C40 family peptidase [Bacillus cihuensis]